MTYQENRLKIISVRMTDPFKLASWLYFRWRRLEVEVHDVGAHRAEDLEGSLREAACLQ